MFECRTFITVKEIAEVLGVSESKSYGIVRVLNKELLHRALRGEERKLRQTRKRVFAKR